MLFNVWILKNAVYRASGAVSKTFLRCSLQLFCINEKLKKNCLINFWKHHATSCDGDVTCVSGCCKNNPCQNGGTCTEICEPTSVRYNCSCPAKFIGRHCEKRKSCQAYKAAGEKSSGLYTESLMTAINPSKCSATLTLNPGLHGTWSSRSAYQRKTFLGQVLQMVHYILYITDTSLLEISPETKL